MRFEDNTGVIILAATNRPESLDPALTRPGRFDRRVPVELPDLKGREAILKVHARKIKTDGNVDYRTIARMASGASGAELANIINEGALRAVRDGRSAVTQSDLEESVEVVIAGYQKKNAILSDQEKRTVAYHEIGHALVAAKQTDSAPVQKITIIPRTSGALGYTMQVEEGDKYLLTKEEMENKIATYAGGRAAEEVVFGQISTGASNDIEQATKLARAMITRYGMDSDFDMVAMETENNPYLGGDTTLSCSADTQKEIDKRVVKLVKTQHEKARTILDEQSGRVLPALASASRHPGDRTGTSGSAAWQDWLSAGEPAGGNIFAAASHTGKTEIANIWNYDARNYDNYFIRSKGKAKPWNPFYRYRFGVLYKHYMQLTKRYMTEIARDSVSK